MPAPVLKDLESQEKATQLIAAIGNQAEVARQLNVSEPTISRFAAKNRERIERAAQQYLDALPNIIEQDIFEILNSGELSKDLIQLLKDKSVIIQDDKGNALELFPKDKVAAIQKFLEYTSKKVTDLKRSIGILPALTPSIVYQSLNIYNDNRQQISPQIMALLSGKIGDMTNDNPGVDCLTVVPTSVQDGTSDTV